MDPIGASRRERALVAAAFVVLAALRLATLAPDPWEWDEVLFMQGVRDGLDVRLNHPHAPGYPVFIRLGQAIRAAGVEPFRATALAGAAGGFLAALALYLLLREVGSRRGWALTGALFYALTPAVWLHGVRPLSDGPGAAAALLAAVFLVRAISGRGRHDLAWAAACTALAAGVRPQVGLALLPAAAAAAAVVFRRERSARPLLLALVTGVLLSAAIWIPVFRSSGGFAAWRERLVGQVAYVTAFDSPTAKDLVEPVFWRRWWLDPVGDGALAGAFLAVAAAGIAAGRRKAGLVLLVFVPIVALTLGVLSKDSAPRYALAFWAAPCALAVFALERLERAPLGGFGRIAAPAVALAGLAAFAALGAPAIVEVASKPSPSVAAMRALGAAGVAAESVYVTAPLQVHASEFFGRSMHVVDETSPLALPPGAAWVGAEDRPFGVVPRRVFTFEHPLLERITRGRYLRTEIFEGAAGAGVFVPAVAAPGWQRDGRVELPEGTALTVYAATPADVSFSAAGSGGDSEIEIRTAAGVRATRASADRAGDVSFAAVPEASETLFSVAAVRGKAVLDAFRILARADGRPARREDNGIPVSIDEPVEGARVPATFRASGWCQERGGGRVDPVQFRLDGRLLSGVSVRRFPRPDVASVLPEIGDGGAAGWEADLSSGVAPGRHVLTVTFQAGDRRRTYRPRGIEIAPGGPPP